MENKLTVEEIRKAASNMKLPIKPMPVKVPDSIKKYDKIRLSQERTKKILQMY